VYAWFGEPVVYASEPAPSHVSGLNTHITIIDNIDGEVLAIDRIASSKIGDGRNSITLSGLQNVLNLVH